MGNVSGAVVAVISGIIGLAIVAVLVGTRAQTATVVTAFGGALGNVIGKAVSPVTGGNTFGSGGPGQSVLAGFSFP